MPQPNSQPNNVYRLRPVSSNVNDWDVITILSQGLPERKVVRLNGDVEHIKYNRDYFTVERASHNPDELYRFSTQGISEETWTALRALKSHIPSRGSGIGIPPVASCLIERGSRVIREHDSIKELSDIIHEFHQSQHWMDSYSISAIHGMIQIYPDIKQGTKKTHWRVPIKVWDDSNLSELSSQIECPIYWLGNIAIISSLKEQSRINQGHARNMNLALQDFFSGVKSKCRLVKTCLETALV